ncbi:uncharacterized protein B0H64DRAFT_390060 [Chaetomium fimeti]|uniref:Integrase zinc-binding domain-containing protein n=1 Tax=Chaetomium fimeti TaxID=1854472 RepID=A0AAE0HHK5_9PEZI|nr:hypothetical protein B0H64DRAFT_390060 [Chaetomium fimeti]
MAKDLANLSFARATHQITRYVRHCPECQENATNRQPPLGELNPIDTPPIPGHTITIDFVTAVPVVDHSEIWATPPGGFDSFMSVSGKFDKRTIIIPGRSDWIGSTPLQSAGSGGCVLLHSTVLSTDDTRGQTPRIPLVRQGCLLPAFRRRSSGHRSERGQGIRSRPRSPAPLRRWCKLGNSSRGSCKP